MAEGGYEAVHKVHPAILKLGLQLTQGSVSGASARSLAMLQAFHQLIQVLPRKIMILACTRCENPENSTKMLEASDQTLQLTQGSVSGASARSLAMLQAFHQLIQVLPQKVMILSRHQKSIFPDF